VNKVVDLAADELGKLDLNLERMPGRDGRGDVLAARSPWGGDGKGILILGHLDTVHPHGTLAHELKWRREGDKVYGPGIYDMKAGAYMAMHAYRHIIREGRETPLPIRFMFVPDEEIGSTTSRAAIEAAAAQSKYVLVCEPARDGGKCVTSRKGTGDFTLEFHGRPSHAGLRHQDGRNAINEAARQILKIAAMTDYDREITASCDMISGGTATNVVAAYCKVAVDIRAPDVPRMDELCARIRALTPEDPDVRIEISGGANRPGYVKDAGIAALFEHARGLAAELGFDLQDTFSGGGSDGNFTAAMGVPTLDGLGADGAGAHTLDEYVYYSSLTERTALLIRLMETLR
jgi:glutamate carboxypeptidase